MYCNGVGGALELSESLSGKCLYQYQNGLFFLQAFFWQLVLQCARAVSFMR